MGNNNLTKEDITTMNNLLDKMGVGTSDKKNVRKHDGLIERVTKNKVILTEDNRQILTD